jgi:hypothetical protein
MENTLSPVLTADDQNFMRGGFVRANTKMVWSRISCPECDLEMAYDPDFRTRSCPPQVRAMCPNNHICDIGGPVVAEKYPFEAIYRRGDSDDPFNNKKVIEQ